MEAWVAHHLARNIKQLREARNLTQNQLAKIAKIPRPTVSNLESGLANPTLSVLVKLASSLQVSVESLISAPRSTTKFYPHSSLPTRKKNEASVRQVLPDVFGGFEMDRMELSPQGRMIGMPHKSGTREYFICEIGEFELAVAGETWKLTSGDVVVFRGDQRHSYVNPTDKISIGYSVILIGPTLI